MRKKLLGFSALGALAITAGALITIGSPEPQFVPRTSGDQVFAAKGASEYLHKMRANQKTGEISQKDVQQAFAKLQDMQSVSHAENIGLNWVSKGPDNQGGRTRDIIIDKDSNNVVYIASVAGGVFKSKNGGQSWFSASANMQNLATVSLTQAANGDLYAGTGEGMYAFVKPGSGSATSPGMTGGGIYKSTDHGQSWTLLSATEPPANNNNAAWSAVGSLGADPTDANRIYAGTFGGLQMSDDGGATWSNPVGQGGSCTDLTVGNDGSVWINLSGRTFYSPNGDANTWSEISSNVPGSTGLPRVTGRQKYAVASNPDIVYVAQTAGSQLSGIYKTENRGQSWELIQGKTTWFDPLCASQCQGIWDLMLGVDPQNSDHIFFGGVTTWEWEKNNGWRKVDGGFFPFDVHADVHDVIWDPNNSQNVYIVSDGGVHKSADGGYSWQDFNKNFTTTQFYNIGIGEDRAIIGGTQDNGSWVMRGQGNTPNEGEQLGGVDNFRGDGGFSIISWLDNTQYFTEYQSGRMGRSENSGESFTSFWDNRMVANGNPGSSGFSGWMMPYDLHETTNDLNSWDSVDFVATPSLKSEGFANGDTLFQGVLPRSQASAKFETTSFKIEAGSVVFTSDAQGNLTGPGTGSFNSTTGEYVVDFDNSPVAEIIITCDVFYNSGDEVLVGSKINALPFKHQLTQAMAPNDSILIQDPVQSVLVAGLGSGVWMTRMAHNWEDPTKWWLVGNTVGTPQSVEISADGNYVWVGTEQGRLYRISGLNGARSLATADVAQGDSSVLQVSSDFIRNFGRYVTNIAVDPNDPDRVAVTLGNYGNSTYVYMSTNATSASPTFTGKQGNLPEFPVYSVTFDKGNTGNLIIGTEYGIFTTDDINAASPQWTEENAGMARVPVFTLTQYRTDKSSPSANDEIMEGDIFAGTHARGTFWADALQTARPIGIDENNEEFTFDDKSNSDLQLFPNPAVNHTTVELTLNKRTDVIVTVLNMNGAVVNQINFDKMAPGKQEIRINTSDLASGTYIVSLQQGEKVKSGRFVVAK